MRSQLSGLRSGTLRGYGALGGAPTKRAANAFTPQVRVRQVLSACRQCTDTVTVLSMSSGDDSDACTTSAFELGCNNDPTTFMQGDKLKISVCQSCKCLSEKNFNRMRLMSEMQVGHDWRHRLENHKAL